MAPVLETGLLNYFSIIFPAILVFVIVYALFQKLKILGESKSIHAIAAIVIAFMLMLSREVMTIINYMAPWFVLMFIFIVLLLVVYKTLGASDKDLSTFILTDNAAKWAIFAVGIIILISAISHVYGQRLLPITTEGAAEIEPTVTNATEPTTAGPGFRSNVASIFFHPKIIGLIFIMLVAVFTIALLTKDAL